MPTNKYKTQKTLVSTPEMSPRSVQSTHVSLMNCVETGIRRIICVETDHDQNYHLSFLQQDHITPQKLTTDTAVDLKNQIAASGFLFNQMGVKPSVRTYGNRAVKAIIAECVQLDEKGAFKP
jgi:hypothetical protein